jgi:branched-chain amino acid transport system permease protein
MLPELFRDFADYRMLGFGAALVLMMIFRPQGLLGTAKGK